MLSEGIPRRLGETVGKPQSLPGPSITRWLAQPGLSNWTASAPTGPAGHVSRRNLVEVAGSPLQQVDGLQCHIAVQHPLSSQKWMLTGLSLKVNRI